tara:strand:- start:4538 stop:4795 length:258 start_codon:yes stop_codon:yes gene_type:complete
LFSNYQKTDVFMECHKVTLEIKDDHARFSFYRSNGNASAHITVIEPTDITGENVTNLPQVWMDGFLEKDKTYVLMEVKNDSDTIE